ncbi:MAG TPA: nickel pincer cofactor biosynthesis protein LarC [Bacteroidota bacterium]|nr:nickel pincer cofactor biosynthesis protein LarC [Bacteroidota bacterium]
MTIAYFDTVAGISGDMTLGALVDAGVPLDHLRAELSKLRVEGYTLETRKVERSAISAIKLDVVLAAGSHGHLHEHGDHASHGHGGEHHSHHDHAHDSRSLKDILALIAGSGLNGRVRERASGIFSVIGEAEAKIHNTTPEEVHFHEVGAVDSIVDVVGTSICLEYLGVDQVYSSPVKLGSGGFVETRHGRMPIPAPATVEILRGYPSVLTDIPFELTTPTGAGIIKALSMGQCSMEALRISSIGYGSGSRDMPQVPNLLRVFIGTLEPAHEQDELLTVETNIDNMNPEIFPYVIERLLSGGAHDAYLVPVVMKKGRPGIVLSVLVNRGKLDPVLDTIFAETTTLGVRIQPVERRKVKRGSKKVKTSFGEMNVKVINHDGVERLSPEFEECKRIAAEKRIPLIDVYRQVEAELR